MTKNSNHQPASKNKNHSHDNSNNGQHNANTKQHSHSASSSKAPPKARQHPMAQTTTSWHISITSLAIISRLLILLLQLVANLLIPDHDAGVFVAPRDPSAPSGKLDGILQTLFGGLHRWDAQYFLHISEHGYSYENTLAFFPLFPFIIKLMTTSLGGTTEIVSYRELSLVLAILLNQMCFVLAAKALYRLSNLVLGNKKKSELAVILFCFNPSSIFFSAPYTESLYAWLSFTVMAQCIDDINSVFITIPLSLSILCRSNGILNIGFLLFFTARRILSQNSFHNIICIGSKLFSILIIIIFHYGIVQVYYYYLFCFEQKFSFPAHVKDYGMVNGLVLAGNKTATSSPWCSNFLPLSYSYVQSHYWDVGFMKYYQIKQLPNFLLALPVIYLIVSNSYNYIIENWDYCARLGLFRVNKKQVKCMKSYDRLAFPFLAHGLFLTLFSVLFVHIQVTTRMVASSSPLLYWFAAEYFTGDRAFIKRQVIRKLSRQVQSGTESCSHVENHVDLSEIFDFRFMNFKQQAILVYFISYVFVGTVLFSNFLPWT
ncbi:GPI mannosyltransferase 2-like [Uranotaenia lowii]|uniref:GPI mannosyltransferase 2-like n=1 Tax=Uranotaenia lowii TaxID=190385 RepID=UPI00247AED41|nr:GPI mannosyltransferase 2-like [Uranotaenia lowii]